MLRYERFTHEIRTLVEKLLARADISATLEARTKSIESFASKIARPGKSYTNPLQDVTDLSGLRIVTTSLDTAEKVAAIVRSEFSVDATRSLNKAEALDADRFGYLSQHFIVSVPPTRRQLTEWEEFIGLYAEVQVRTALQHTWSVVQHPLDYKSAVDIPKPLRRRLFRLSALFELADEELNSLVRDAAAIRASYAVDTRTQPAQLQIDLDSLRAYLVASQEVARWDEFWNSLPFSQTEAPAWGERDVSMPRLCGIRALADYDALLRDSHGWGEDYSRDVLLSIRGSPSTPISTTRNGILMYLLIGNFPDVLTADTLQHQFGFGLPQPMLSSALLRNPRFRSNAPPV